MEEKPNKSLRKSQLVSIAFQLGFIIAIPVVVFGYLGKWLDGKAGTYPLLTLIGIFTAIGFTSLWIYRKFRGYFKDSGSDLSRPSPPSAARGTLPRPGEGREGSNHNS